MGPIEEQAFEAMFETHGSAVLSYLTRRTDRATAEDVLSETFLVAWRRRSELPAEPLPWLYGVARRVLANQRRGDRRRVSLQERIAGEWSTTDATDATDDGGWSGATLAALDALPAADREVLMLDAWEELTRDEAAIVLGCRPSTYGVRLHRARRRFARAFASAQPGAIPHSPKESRA